jgi:hypothetical protein
VLATLEFLAASGLRPTVTSLKCGPRLLHGQRQRLAPLVGQRGRHRRVNGIPIIGHQGRGSITDIAIQRLLTLQGTLSRTRSSR